MSASRYGPEVQQALVEAWKTTKYICTKRLIPYLSTLVATLELHGHLHLTEENRSHLLRVSATTAERVLRSHRTSAPRGLSTTQAGPLRKQQISLRTFHNWDEAQPGFLEADLVAHCGEYTQGSYLYTLTLTDVATGWTECLPVLYKGPEAVLSALQQGRAFFPFPILGLDVDNRGEFINASLMRDCEAEQITFTRGHPGCKADQCFVEQKNGAIVRQFVGHGRLVGEQAYRQLRELYRAVRLYVNCFQPSMKLLSKHRDGEKVRQVYDSAKIPWQRLVLSGILPAASQHQLYEVVQALELLSLLHHLEDVQQALWRCIVHASPLTQNAPAAALVRFSVQRGMQGALVPQERISAQASVLQRLQSEQRSTRDVIREVGSRKSLKPEARNRAQQRFPDAERVDHANKRSLERSWLKARPCVNRQRPEKASSPVQEKSQPDGLFLRTRRSQAKPSQAIPRVKKCEGKRTRILPMGKISHDAMQLYDLLTPLIDPPT